RLLRVYSDQPCLGLYTSGYLDGTRTGTQGKSYVRNGALCLETQQYPDAVNRPEFPSTLVEAGSTYNALTVWEFGVVKLPNSQGIIGAARLHQRAGEFRPVDSIGILLRLQAKRPIPHIAFPLRAGTGAVQVAGSIKSQARLVGIYSQQP